MNPYAAPQSLPVALHASISYPRSVVLIYRWVGAVGLAACGVAFLECLAIFDEPRDYGPLALILAHAGVFGFDTPRRATAGPKSESGEEVSAMDRIRNSPHVLPHPHDSGVVCSLEARQIL
jgi:hypothetical protein